MRTSPDPPGGLPLPRNRVTPGGDRHWTFESPHDIHVWIVPLAEAALEPAWAILAPEERRRARRFGSDDRRRAYVIARGVLRALLGRHLRMNPEEIALEYTEHGKPILAALSDAASVQFNVAHSGAVAALAFGLGEPVGVDLERIRSIKAPDLIAARLFTRDERARFSGLTGDAQRRAFFRCWTRKEAYLKATGCGLAHATVGEDGVGPPPGKWRLANFDVGNEYIGAIASACSRRARTRYADASQLLGLESAHRSYPSRH